jgi:hypothetical protein
MGGGGELVRHLPASRYRPPTKPCATSQPPPLPRPQDCTESMQPWIDWARSQVQTIVADLQRAHANLRCRVAFVGYRDVCEAEADRYKIVPYTDPETVAREMAEVRAFGGGDAAEDVFNGLRKVLALPQDASTPNDITILLHVCDAPCHGTRYHDILLSDAHPKPAGTLYGGHMIEDLVKVRKGGACACAHQGEGAVAAGLVARITTRARVSQLVAGRGWDYLFVRINSTTDQMVSPSREARTAHRRSACAFIPHSSSHPPPPLSGARQESIFERTFDESRRSSNQTFERVDAEPVRAAATPRSPAPDSGRSGMLESAAAPVMPPGARHAAPAVPLPTAAVAAAAGGVEVRPVLLSSVSSAGPGHVVHSASPALAAWATAADPTSPGSVAAAVPPPAGVAARAGGVAVPALTTSAVTRSLLASLDRRAAAGGAAAGGAAGGPALPGMGR